MFKQNKTYKYYRQLLFCVFTTLFVLTASLALAKTPKNIILMISDGTGYNSFNAASMYRGKYGKEIYNGAGWVQYGVSTYPLNLSSSPQNTYAQNLDLRYDPAMAWNTKYEKILTGGSGEFASYNYLKSTATDSAAAATAISAGIKTYNNAIGWSDHNKPLVSINERMKALGKATGVITTVPWSHATPAGMLAHNVSRNNYVEIANEMLSSSIDVIFGAGSPDFNDSGKPETKEANYVGGKETWALLKTNQYPGRTSIQTAEQFKALTKGNPTGKYVGTAQVYSTFQQGRAGYTAKDTPSSVPFNKNVPTLKVVTEAALNILDSDSDGFFLMIEGGAVDWANHANQLPRMIEEIDDFQEALAAVNIWVEKNSSWDDTIVIVTSDHECGMLWGPNSDTIAFDPIVDQGKGKMPLAKYNYSSHTNSLVPLWAKGANAELYEKHVMGTDQLYGKWIDNTAVLTAIDGTAEK